MIFIKQTDEYNQPLTKSFYWITEYAIIKCYYSHFSRGKTHKSKHESVYFKLIMPTINHSPVCPFYMSTDLFSSRLIVLLFSTPRRYFPLFQSRLPLLWISLSSDSLIMAISVALCWAKWLNLPLLSLWASQYREEKRGKKVFIFINTDLYFSLGHSKSPFLTSVMLLSIHLCTIYPFFGQNGWRVAE